MDHSGSKQEPYVDNPVMKGCQVSPSLNYITYDLSLLGRRCKNTVKISHRYFSVLELISHLSMIH